MALEPQSPSRRGPLVTTAIVAGRMITLARALITVAIVMRSEVDAVAISQRLGIASILLVGAFAKDGGSDRVYFRRRVLLYVAIPTAPPWLAGEDGAISEDIHRVMPDLSALVAGETYAKTSAAVGVNDVAAIPSLHTALTAVVALIAARTVAGGGVWACFTWQ